MSDSNRKPIAIAAVAVAVAIAGSVVIYQTTNTPQIVTSTNGVVMVKLNLKADKFYRIEYSTNMIDWFEDGAVTWTDISGRKNGVVYYVMHSEPTELPGSIARGWLQPVNGGTDVVAELLLDVTKDQGFVRLREQTAEWPSNAPPPRIVYFP